ncbi:MAG: hypothetical protein AVDCRST_MAG85-3063, partial [uncultured Solirubrobacteraceae bacterium]
ERGRRAWHLRAEACSAPQRSGCDRQRRHDLDGADDQSLLWDLDHDVLRRSRPAALPCSSRRRRRKGPDRHARS